MAAIMAYNQCCLNETGLFKESSHETFNHLKDIHESREVHLDEIVEKLAQDLCKQNLNQYIGISRTHKHFVLNPGEVVQLSLGSSINDASIKMEEDASVVHLKPLMVTKEMLNVAPPIPYMWAYDKSSKQFYPVQFFDGSNKLMQHRFGEVCRDKRNELVIFLLKFIELVEATNTEDDLGFYLRYEHLLKLDKEKEERGLIEETDVPNRRQWMVPKTVEMLQAIIAEQQQQDPNFKLTMTHWFFDDENDMDGSCSCVHYCNHVCKH